MAKKADISSKEFSEFLSEIKHRPHKNIVSRLDSKMFSLDQNKVFNYKPGQLAFHEYKRCLDLFESRNPGVKPEQALFRIGGVQKFISDIEKNHKEQLQNLAIDTIKEIYQVPDYVDLKGFIQPKLFLDTEQDHDKDAFIKLTLEQKNKMRDEIQKRVILNGLVHGSSMHIWKGMYHLVADELDNIHPDLKELYNMYTSTIGITLWYFNPDSIQADIENNRQLTQGLNKLKFNKQKPGGQVEARGINFPVLLHELNKGVIDWLISAGIPKEYTADELKYYYAIADAYENEFWHYLLAPSLWVDLLEVAQVQNENIPKLVIKLTKLSYNELTELFRLIQDDKEEAKKKISKWNLSFQ
jgi:hypothetical protein